MSRKVNVIGAGLAGCEATYQLAKRGIEVVLYESKPIKMSEAHSDENFCELVCSNSLKSDDPQTAHGLLKAELNHYDSLILSVANECRVPAGGALAVDRKIFADKVSQRVKSLSGVSVVNQVVSNIDLNSDDITIIATGPLTLGGLAENLKDVLQSNLSFYDAASPIVSADSIDMSIAFAGSRYGKGGDDDYINCPMDKQEYYAFVSALVDAEKVIAKKFEKTEIFEGCMPVEIMASRGVDTLMFGPLKPVGFTDPRTGKRPYAVVQLRKENASATMYNLVGFQTNLKFGEQKRVFSMIPSLQNAEFLRYGVMHRNTYIDAPKVLSKDFSLKEYPNIFVAGQLSGVEGYVESIASGLVAGINASLKAVGDDKFDVPSQTMLGSLINYITTPNANFQPMNSNFGILPPLSEHVRDKNKRKIAYCERSIDCFKKITI